MPPPLAVQEPPARPCDCMREQRVSEGQAHLLRVRVRVRVRGRARGRGSAARLAPAVHHTVRGTYGAPKLENAYGARTAVRYAPVELPCASGTHGTAAAPYGYPPGPPCAPGTCGTAMPHRHVCLGRTLLLYVRHSTGHMPYQPGPPCASGTCGTAAALHWPHAPINPGLAPCPPSRK